MSKFFDLYQAKCKALSEECDRMVADGECTQEFADFRYEMVKDEILEDMPDEVE